MKSMRFREIDEDQADYDVSNANDISLLPDSLLGLDAAYQQQMKPVFNGMTTDDLFLSHLSEQEAYCTVQAK